MQTLQELDARVVELQNELEIAQRKACEAHAHEKKRVISELNVLIEKHSITADELSFAKLPKEKRTHSSNRSRTAPSLPKYENKDTGQTWTGHGQPPAWIPKEKAERIKFLIEK